MEFTITEERLKEIEEAPREAFIAKAEAKKMVDSYRDRKPISTRDLVAFQALGGMLAGVSGMEGSHWDGNGDAEYYAQWAYAYADAMLKEREKGPNELRH